MKCKTKPLARPDRWQALFVLYALSLALTGCLESPAPPGPEEAHYRLEFKRPPGELRRYEARFTFNSKGPETIRESTHSIIYEESLGRTEEGFDKVALRRREISRQRTERSAPGHLVETNAPRDLIPQLSPNFALEKDGAGEDRLYYPLDARGRLGLREATPYHFLLYDSIVYILPLLPERAVAARSRWRSELPVAVGAQYFQNNFILPVHLELTRIEGSRGPLVAVISYSYQGQFDTREYRERYNDNFHASRRDIHRVEGRGRAWLELERGVLLKKDDQTSIQMTRLLLRPRTTSRSGKKTTLDVWEELNARHQIASSIRLMAPEEELPEVKVP